MRRSPISLSTIKMIESYRNKKEREETHRYLINKSTMQGNEKEPAPEYAISEFDFDRTSRIAHIEFTQLQKYRTITRYATRNYVKYPVYSDWKTRKKTITKTLKLTNLELEGLNDNDDFLVRKFAKEIIIRINDEELFPSWFIKEYLKEELDDSLKAMKNELDAFVLQQHKNIDKSTRNKSLFKYKNSNLRKKLLEVQAEKDKLSSKLSKAQSRKQNTLKSILSFGIYSYLISESRKGKLNAKLRLMEDDLSKIKKAIADNNAIINMYEDAIVTSKSDIAERKENYEKEIEERKTIYNEKLSKVKTLMDSAEPNGDFALLKYYCGLEYEKIIGIYIIHNRENDKYYVGQSKDVLKRLKQHFNGTVPRNIIFAEDYYHSHFENLEDLFEVQIIR